MEAFLQRVGKQFVSPRPGFTDRLWSRLKERKMFERFLDMLVDKGLPVTIDGRQKIPSATLKRDPYAKDEYDYVAETITKAGGYQVGRGHFSPKQIAYINVDHNEITLVMGAF